MNRWGLLGGRLSLLRLSFERQKVVSMHRSQSWLKIGNSKNISNAAPCQTWISSRKLSVAPSRNRDEGSSEALESI